MGILYCLNGSRSIDNSIWLSPVNRAGKRCRSPHRQSQLPTIYGVHTYLITEKTHYIHLHLFPDYCFLSVRKRNISPDLLLRSTTRTITLIGDHDQDERNLGMKMASIMSCSTPIYGSQLALMSPYGTCVVRARAQRGRDSRLCRPSNTTHGMRVPS